MFGPMEAAVIAGVAMLLFGADKLPKLARSAGQAKKEFLRGQDESGNEPTAPTDAPVAAGVADEKQPPTQPTP